MSHLAYISRSLNKIVVEAPWNADYAKAINFVIPPTARRQRDGIWQFDLMWAPAIIDITQYYFPHNSNTVDLDSIEVFDLTWVSKWSKFLLEININELETEYYVSGTSPYIILYLQDNAPSEVIKAAYRALSKMYHPDTGGDPNVFKRIQEAYEKIKVD